MNNRLKKYFEENADNYEPLKPSHPMDANEEGFCHLDKACIQCGEKHDLRAFAHGNQTEEMVGLLIFCGKCFQQYAGKRISIDVTVRDK